jgi:2-alkyl-3-oxoalkanoate reductase
MKILVTGATGFLGKHLIKSLTEQGFEVRAFGRNFSDDFWQKNDIEKVQADIRSLDAVQKAMMGMDYVIHAAALSAPWGARQDFWSINVNGTKNVYSACLSRGIQRCVYISSPAVVFEGKDCHLLPDNAPYPKRFSSHYAESKKEGEKIMLGLPNSVILRPKAIYGVGDNALLPRLVASIRSKRLRQIGNGENLVAFTHVSEVVQACMLALKANPDSEFPVYTIAGEPVELWSVIRKISEHLGYEARFPQISPRVALALAFLLEQTAQFTAREPTLTRYAIQILFCEQTYDTSRAKRDLGWETKLPFDQGLNELLQNWGER